MASTFYIVLDPHNSTQRDASHLIVADQAVINSELETVVLVLTDQPDEGIDTLLREYRLGGEDTYDFQFRALYPNNIDQYMSDKPHYEDLRLMAEIDPPEDTVAMRFNEGKPPVSYVLHFPNSLEFLARVLEQGAKKYNHLNFKLGGKPNQEYLDSAIRHLLAWVNGETFDEDMGTNHLGNVLFNVLMLIENQDRYAAMNPAFDQEQFEQRWDYKP